MRKSSINTFGAAALFSSLSVMPAGAQTDEAIRTANTLNNSCSALTDSSGTVVNDALVNCLKALKAETIAFGESQIDLFSINNETIRNQDGFVAAQARGALLRDCRPVAEKTGYETPQEAILAITGMVQVCADTIYDSGHLKTIKYAFDDARHAAIAITSNCVRGLVDADARAACESYKSMGYRVPVI